MSRRSRRSPASLRAAAYIPVLERIRANLKRFF
jgi:hypothetical protein